MAFEGINKLNLGETFIYEFLFKNHFMYINKKGKE